MINGIRKFLRDVVTRIRKIWNLPNEYESYHEATDAALNRMMASINTMNLTVNERCEVHADIHYKFPHQIIVVGRYNGRDYVRIFDVADSTFRELIERLRYEERNSRVGRFDTPTWPSLSVVYPHDRF